MTQAERTKSVFVALELMARAGLKHYGRMSDSESMADSAEAYLQVMDYLGCDLAYLAPAARRLCSTQQEFPSARRFADEVLACENDSTIMVTVPSNEEGKIAVFRIPAPTSDEDYERLVAEGCRERGLPAPSKQLPGPLVGEEKTSELAKRLAECETKPRRAYHENSPEIPKFIEGEDHQTKSAKERQIAAVRSSERPSD